MTHFSGVASLPSVVVQSNKLVLKLTDDFESNGSVNRTIMDIVGFVFKFEDYFCSW